MSVNAVVNISIEKHRVTVNTGLYPYLTWGRIVEEK